MTTNPKFHYDPETGQIFKSTDLLDPSDYPEFKVRDVHDMVAIELNIQSYQECIDEIKQSIAELEKLKQDFAKEGKI